MLKLNKSLRMVSCSILYVILLARRILNFMNQRADIPMIIGLTHRDLPEAWTPENISLALGFLDANNKPPMIEVNGNEQASVAEAVIALVEHLMQVSLVS